ncbi:hypothetical protein [Kangiella sp. HZ709]|uniref:hypothetical protein n=1 Tax=Kangiella sp. HZ709 TaxID=2666328 RepID=UPI0012B0552F|nr:hypothetical protein [Kangiella sp. HZ709]MRX28160.1 hypothetical protein [Kangiella sp. HZ709]
MSKSRQAILKFISIKLNVDTHKKYRKILSRIFGAAFFVFIVLGLYNALDRHNHAVDFKTDIILIDADLEELEYVSDEESRYRYFYSVNGQGYYQDFEAPFIQYDSAETVKIAYKTDKPGLSERVDVIEKYHGIGHIFKTFGLLLVFGGLGFLVLYGFLTYGIIQPKEDYEDDEDESNDKNLNEVNSSTDNELKI